MQAAGIVEASRVDPDIEEKEVSAVRVRMKMARALMTNAIATHLFLHL